VSYAALKIVHVACAGLSYALFVLRGIWRLTGSPLASQRWARVVPHVNDTVLLLAALGMAVSLAPYPGYHGFLAAKLGGLIAYILLGISAFRWARSRSARVGAWIAAQVVFFYIVAVALSKSPGVGLIG
jgi:uncharacterized membrane protein SirB2